MIGEVGGGSSFRGLVHYLAHGRRDAPKEPLWIQARNLYAREPGAARLEMEATAAQNPRVEKPVLHLMVSPAPGDQLEGEDWNALADRVLGDLGLAEHEAFVVLHTDTETPHLHIAVNRVHPFTHRAWETWRSKTRLEGILRSIEREWGLRQVPGRLAAVDRGQLEQPTFGPTLTVGEQAQLEHRAEEPQVLRWRRSLAPHLKEASSWTDLAARLKAHGLQLAARGRGLVVTDGERFVKASRLSRDSSRGKLEARFGETFGAWRESLDRFESAAQVYPRYLARASDHPRSAATARVLRSTGRRLGWRALGQLEGPLAPAVSSLVAGVRRLDRELARGTSWDAYVRRHLRPALMRSRSWAEAEGRLRLYGAWIARAPGAGDELLVTDGQHRSALAQLGDEFSRKNLDARLGPWSAWERSRQALHQAANRYATHLQRAEDRAQRWRRIAGIIRSAERRIERFDSLGTELGRVEASLRRQLQSFAGQRDPAAVEALLRRLRQARNPDQVEHHLAKLGRRRLLGLRRATVRPGLVATAQRYRQLAGEVRRLRAPARSASRRLAHLRRRARLLSPTLANPAARRALVAAARPLVSVGVRSLLARAAPGVGPALAIVRALRPRARAHDRGLER